MVIRVKDSLNKPKLHLLQTNETNTTVIVRAVGTRCAPLLNASHYSRAPTLPIPENSIRKSSLSTVFSCSISRRTDRRAYTKMLGHAEILIAKRKEILTRGRESRSTAKWPSVVTVVHHAPRQITKVNIFYFGISYARETITARRADTLLRSDESPSPVEQRLA